MAAFGSDLSLQHGERVGESAGDVDGLRHTFAVHEREAFHRVNEIVNSPGGHIDLTRRHSGRRAAGDPSDGRPRRLRRKHTREAVQTGHRQIRGRERAGGRGWQTMACEPLGDLILAVGGFERRSRLRRRRTFVPDRVESGELIVAEPGRHELPGGALLLVDQADQRSRRTRGR